ncbi:MAG: hypothetical protein ACRBCL_11155 [Maritimibacter sp.]
MKTVTYGALFAMFATGAFASSTEGMKTFLVEKVAPWASDPVLIEAIKAQNAKTGGMSLADIEAQDQVWRGQIGSADTSLIDSVLNAPSSEYLRQQVEAAGGQITEVFIMDAQGLNVAASAVTSDYWQGDEAKFSETYGIGVDAMHFSEIELDESTREYQAQLSMTLVDPASGEAIGAMTVGVNAEAFE